VVVGWTPRGASERLEVDAGALEAGTIWSSLDPETTLEDMGSGGSFIS
jgi:hypothetical protein